MAGKRQRLKLGKKRRHEGGLTRDAHRADGLGGSGQLRTWSGSLGSVHSVELLSPIALHDAPAEGSWVFGCLSCGLRWLIAPIDWGQSIYHARQRRGLRGCG